MYKAITLLIMLGGLTLSACNQQSGQPVNTGKLKALATTTIVGDVVSQVGGDLIELEVLLPVGADPHSFDLTPQDVAKVVSANVVFANGAGLEDFMDNLIKSAEAQDKVVQVSDGIDLRSFDDKNLTDHETEEHENEYEGEAYDQNSDEDQNHAWTDPHTWTDPNNVLVWVNNIQQALTELDPEHAELYKTNAESYLAELTILDVWIRKQVAQIPEKNRKVVTDHAIFGYFVEEYGFEQVGALIPGYSTLAQPTAQEMAGIEDIIRTLNVKAIFVGNTVNPSLAQRVADDTGVDLVYVYTGSLSKAGGEADTYLAYMRYNTNAFVNALK